MLKLKFEISKFHLAYNLCTASLGDPGLRRRWDKVRQTLIAAYGDSSPFLLFKRSDTGLALNFCGLTEDPSATLGAFKDENTLREIFVDIFKTRSFQDALSETTEFKDVITRSWRQYSRMATPFIERVTNISSDRSIRVVVLHPAIGIGSYMGRDMIEWGYPDQYPNSHVVGLTHEVLHCLTDNLALRSGSQGKWLLHALIYLAANEELRCRLNPRSTFFDAAIIRDYDPRLIRLARNFEPLWKQYVTENHSGRGWIFELFDKIGPVMTGADSKHDAG